MKLPENAAIVDTNTESSKESLKRHSRKIHSKNKKSSKPLKIIQLN